MDEDAEYDATRDTRWYSDDFETTTDLDGTPEPWSVSSDEEAECVDLEPGECRLRVYTATKTRPVTRTITYRRETNGTLTATTRTGRVRVWSWSIREVDGLGKWRGTDIADYVTRAAELGGIHWFHNLRFDAAFLDTYLQDEPPLGLGMSSGKWFSRQVPQGSFGALISDMGAHYARYIHLQDGRRFEVRDSLKKFPSTSVAALAEMFAAPQPKGEIEYTLERPAGYQPTEAEWAYLETDTEIVATALAAPKSVGADGLTVGGDALAEFKRLHEGGTFRTTFPLLERETDDFIRRALRGGWSYANPLWQGQLLDCEGAVEDVNSMYPALMHRHSFPVGTPIQLAPGQTGAKGYPHTIIGAMIDATIRPGKLPVIQVKRDPRYNPVQYQTEVRGVEWYGTEIDWALLYENYEVDVIGWYGGLAFKGRAGLFNRYIDKWMRVKEEAGFVMAAEKKAGRYGSVKWAKAAGERAQAKFQLNNLWGRFTINPLRASRLPRLTDDGAPTYTLGSQQYDEPSYTAVGVFTTSYGRDYIIRNAQSFGDDFLYADTDSIHHKGLGTGTLEMHDTKLGAWKREGVFDQATYLRAKSYAERVGGEADSHVAGLPRKLLDGLRVEDLVIGAKFHGKLVPKRVPGGVILESTDFIIGAKDAWGNRS